MINKILKNYIDTRPEDIFINYNNSNITYDDMAYAVEGRIKSMQAINIQKGDLVGIYLESSLNLLEVLFGCIEIQATPLIIPADLTSNEINNLSNSVNFKYFITDWNKSKNIKNNRVPTFPIEELSPGIGGCAPSLRIQSESNQIACLLLTSGTTGITKAVQLTYSNFQVSCKNWNNFLHFKSDDQFLCCLPIHHIGGLAVILRALIYGFSVNLITKFHADSVLTAIQKLDENGCSAESRLSNFPSWRN